MAEENKVDLTAKLPDEMLIEVFDRLPSLRDKLRLERVSRRFQRCLYELFNVTKPIQLVFDSKKMKLNGCGVSREQLPGVVEMLANKAKFSRIELNYAPRKRLNEILTALVSLENDCLNKVTSFQVLSQGGVRGGLLTEVLAKCARLSSVRIDWSSADLEKLQLALKEKTLSQLSISLYDHTQEQLTQLYRSIKPNVLKKTRLGLLGMTLDVDLLVKELYKGSWAALEEIDFRFQLTTLDMAAFFASLIDLPALRKCNFELQHIQPDGQVTLLAALTALFTNQIEITVGFRCFCFGCALVNLIRQLQAIYPGLQVDFGVADQELKLTLTLGKVCFVQTVVLIGPCPLVDCAVCGVCYPVVIESLMNRASQRALVGDHDVHLADHRLDRCRVNSVVEHLNQTTLSSGDPLFEVLEKRWRALHAEINQAQNQATITFESLVDEEPFQITVGCGPCLSNSCAECVNVV